jgi:hypothetical protein
VSTVLSLCQDAIREVGSFSAPTYLVGNEDPIAQQILALSGLVGKRLAQEDWSDLLTEYTFPTVNGTSTYSLPSDHDRFANATFWDGTEYEPLVGPMTNKQWQHLKRSVAAPAGIETYFRIRAGLFEVFPTPTDARTLVFEYYSKNWVIANGDTDPTKAAITADNDTTIFDERLFIDGLKAVFLQAKSLPYEVEAGLYQSRLDKLIANDGGAQVVRFGSRIGTRNLPETGFGA